MNAQSDVNALSDMKAISDSVFKLPASSSRARSLALRNAMTVDVEDYFQVQAFASVISRSEWDTIPTRVEANVDKILQKFARTEVHATFFTLGWVAERHPEIVRRIVAGGHELASHGYGHARVDSLDRESFRADVRRAKAVLEDVGGVKVSGYRAPTFSIGRHTPWAAEVLQTEGYAYSSSIYPIRHDLYGAHDAPRFPFRPTPGAICEIPMTTLRMAGRNLPFSGGGYFRLMPYAVFRTGLRRFNREEGAPGVFYFHPWEIDVQQPRVANCGRMSRFRHYVNIPAMSARLDRLLRDFAWDRMDRVFASSLEAAELEPPSAVALVLQAASA